MMKCCLVVAALVSLPLAGVPAERIRLNDEAYFTLDNGIDLRNLADEQTRRWLTVAVPIQYLPTQL